MMKFQLLPLINPRHDRAALYHISLNVNALQNLNNLEHTPYSRIICAKIFRNEWIYFHHFPNFCSIDISWC